LLVLGHTVIIRSLFMLRRPPRNSELLHTRIATSSSRRYLLTDVTFILESDDLCILWIPHLTLFERLLSRGHKVGIVGQTETAALKKAGENRNAPFERERTHIYTAVT